MRILAAGIVVCVSALMIFMSDIKAGDGKVEYPEGYRDWKHVKSMVILTGHPLEDPFKGIHHIYANSEAVKGYSSGKFGEGSVIVFDLLEYDQRENAITEGERKLVGVMVKDSSLFTDTGGWGFEGFAGNSRTQRLVSDGGNSCFGCHESQKENDYVFSESRN